MPISQDRRPIRPSRRSFGALFAALTVAAVLIVSGCGGSSSSSSSSTTESTTGSIVPQSPSTLPAPSTTAATANGALCSLFSDLYGIENLQPKNTPNWSAEQQRIGVDAQRESALLVSMKGIAPANLAASIQSEIDYANFVAETISTAASYAAATSALNGYNKRADVTAATATLSNWKTANCPR